MKLSSKNNNIKFLETRNPTRITIESYTSYISTITIEEDGVLHFFKIHATLGGIVIQKEKLVEVARVRRKSPKIQAAAQMIP